tara:strand:+ start:194 stop:316 length:123 start_codon:yes stop_codon:yes gene_type:complete
MRTGYFFAKFSNGDMVFACRGAGPVEEGAELLTEPEEDCS